MKKLNVSIQFSEKNWKKLKRFLGRQENESFNLEGDLEIIEQMIQVRVDQFMQGFRVKRPKPLRRKMQLKRLSS